MKYRCPYCGEEAFPLMEKLGMRLEFSYVPKSISVTTCPHCNKMVIRPMGKLGYWGHKLIASWIPLLLFFYFLLRYKFSIFLVIGFPLYIILWFSLNYFFCHFDKRRKVEREADARIKMSVSHEQPLWPAVKKGEIYLFKCPERGTAETAPHLIAMVVSRKKSGNHREMELRVIKAVDMALPYPNEPIWLITRGKKVIEGITLSATLAKEVPEF